MNYENTEELTGRTNEIQALKFIIRILQDNPFYLNKFVVADDTVLMEVIKLLTNADDIVMDAEDLGERVRQQRPHTVSVHPSPSTEECLLP